MPRALNNKLKSITALALFAALLLSLCIFGLLEVPVNGSTAQATLEDPMKDFSDIPESTIPATAGANETFYRIHMWHDVAPSVTPDNNYRVVSIPVTDTDGNIENKEYGVYEAYYSNDYNSNTKNDAIDYIIRLFSFNSYYYYAKEEDGQWSVAGPENTIYDILYPDDNGVYDNPMLGPIPGDEDSYEPTDIKLSSCIVQGVRWDGSIYNGQLRDIDAAGTYKIVSISVTFAGNTHTLNNPHLMILLKAKLTVSSSAFSTLFTQNVQFGLNAAQRTYGEKANIREYIGVHNTSQESGMFYFSTDNSNYFHLSNFGKNGAGAQVDSATLTNLNSIKDYLRVDWYKYQFIGGKTVRSLIEDEVFTQADTYSVSLGWTVEFNYYSDYSHYYTRNNVEFYCDMGKVVDVVYGTLNDYDDFYQEFTVEKRKLQFSEDRSATGGRNGGIQILRETEYSGTIEAAETLFTSSPVTSREMWLSLNGLAADYDNSATYDIGLTFAQYLEYYSILSFSGSHFDSASIGAGKNVFMKMTLLAASSNDITQLLQNYEPVIGYYDGETYYQFGYKAGSTQYYHLETKLDIGGQIIFDGSFRILPNRLTLTFSKEANYTYGEKGTISDFDFSVDPVVTAKGTIFTPNWKVYIVKGLAADSAVRNAAENRIYIGIMTGRRDDAASSDIVYVDAEGHKYVMYNARLYAGDYYFYYTVYVLHRTNSSYETNVLPDSERPGVFVIRDQSGNPVAELDLGELQRLAINKLKLSVQVTAMDAVKDYDGTNDLPLFSAQLSGGSIFSVDRAYVDYTLNAYFETSNAGENIVILPDFRMEFVPGYENSPTAARALASYDLDTATILGIWSEKGTINKLKLTVSIVDSPYTINIGGKNYPLYKRNYAENTFVVIQVARAGDVLPDGAIAAENYYYYYYSRTNSGVIAESRLGLGTVLGIPGDKCVKLTMSGFLNGEGFGNWEHSGSVRDFNSSPVDVKDIFSWVDTSRSPSVAISSTTDSSANETDYYRIEYNSAASLYDLYDNYEVIISASSPDYAYLFIDKLDLEPNFLYVQESSLYIYSGKSQINRTVTYQGENSAVFNFSGHVEAMNIVDTLTAMGLTFADLVEVVDFARDCDETCPHNSYDISVREIRYMILAGTYSLKFTLPASRNYKGGTLFATLRIYGKSVQSYVTFAIRSYLESNPYYNTGYNDIIYVNSDNELAMYSYWMKIDDTGTSYEVIAYPKLTGQRVSYYLLSDGSEITESELQGLYNAIKVYIDLIPMDASDQSGFDQIVANSGNTHGSKTVYYKNGSDFIPAESFVGGVTRYYVFNEYGMRNTVIYYGLMTVNDDDEEILEAFTNADTTHTVTFAVNAFNDRAYTSGLDNGVKAEGAFKHNFIISPVSEKFYILKIGLSIDVDGRYDQNGVFSGNELVPYYRLIGGSPEVGFIGINVHAYTYNESTQTYIHRDNNGTIIPIEQIPFGNGLDMNLIEVGVYVLRLYARPNSEFTTNYATSKEPTIITFTVVPLRINFIGEDLTLPYTDTAYETGLFSEYFSGENSNWGTVSIVRAVKNGIEVSEIKDAGVYEVTIIGILLPQFTKNIYFDDGSGGYTYSREFTFLVTITPSATYQFILTNDIGGVDLEDGQGFAFTYNGLTYNPTYRFINLFGNVTSLPVTFTVSNSQGTVTPIKNADIYTLIFTVNAASHPDHNPNYAGFEGDDALVFNVIIRKAPLVVMLGFEEGYSARKTYLDDNSVISDHMFFIYAGWVEGEDGTEPINYITNPPVIDWDFFDGNQVISIGKYTTAGIYGIKPKSGPDTVDLPNYYFSYEGSEIEFIIDKANPYLLVYGLYDAENDEYLDYYYYTGAALEPRVKRMYRGDFIDDSTELLSSDGVRITFMGRFIGLDKFNITDNDIQLAEEGAYCIDVGEYVFRVEVEESRNYNSFPAAYFYLRVEKADLYISVLGTYQSAERGFASMIYNRTENYPVFYVQYSGFLGRDARVSSYSNPFAVYSYNLRNRTTRIEGLDLTHPVYKIYATSDATGDEIIPHDAGTYYVRLFIDNTSYGVSMNYNIIATYLEVGEATLYPVLVIDKRVLDISSGDRINKTYDGTNRLLPGSVTRTKYSFTAKDGVADSGIVPGDENVVNLSVNYNLSYYERKNVYDENGLPTEINIRIYGYSIDNGNYYLDVSNGFLDESDNRYFYLKGSISQASASIIFRDAAGNVVIGRKTVEYDSTPHTIVPTVNGVNSEVLICDVGFTMIYTSTNYSDTRAPSEAGEYTVTVTVTDTNYVNTSVSVMLIIEKASVIITFNGDASPVYATSNMGLVAYAEGVGGYYQPLAVSYFDDKGDFVPNIVRANAGTYTAYAVHNATTNFKYMTATAIFEIRPREVSVIGDIAEKYNYTGKPINPTVTFEFNNVTYYPALKFDVVRVTPQGVTYEPFNYSGDNVTGSAPVNVGRYRVTPAGRFGNFTITGAGSVEYEIVPVQLIIGIADVKVKENEPVVFNFTLKGNIEGEGISNLTVKPSVEYYDTNGNKLDVIPTAAGIYMVKPTGASSLNYEISYEFGILTINKAVLNYEAEDGANLTIEGNFSAGTSIVVKQIDNVQYTSYKTMFENYKVKYPEYARYKLSTVYYVQFDGTVETSDSGKLRVKLLLENVLKNINKESGKNNISYTQKIVAAQEPEYYVAQFRSDGTVDCVKAQVEGQYLVFETTSLEAFSVITDAQNDTKDNSWVLYLAIGIGVLMLAGVILIIKKRA